MRRPLSSSREWTINDAPRLTLLSRDYCHLCHEMRAALNDLRGAQGMADFSLEIVDVDADPVLEGRYGELVPVLLDAAGRALCHYHLDESKVREYLSAFR